MILHAAHTFIFNPFLPNSASGLPHFMQTHPGAAVSSPFTFRPSREQSFLFAAHTGTDVASKEKWYWDTIPTLPLTPENVRPSCTGARTPRSGLEARRKTTFSFAPEVLRLRRRSAALSVDEAFGRKRGPLSWQVLLPLKTKIACQQTKGKVKDKPDVASRKKLGHFSQFHSI